MNFFKDCNTPQERKAKYRELAKVHHPDAGGDLKVMQEINRQYREIAVRKVVITKSPNQQYYEEMVRRAAAQHERMKQFFDEQEKRQREALQKIYGYAAQYGEEREPTGTQEDLEKSQEPVTKLKADGSAGYQRSRGYIFRKLFGDL